MLLNSLNHCSKLLNPKKELQDTPTYSQSSEVWGAQILTASKVEAVL